MDKKETFKKNLRHYMDITGVKSIEICEAMGIHRGTFSKWYNGASLPSAEMMEKLSKVLGVTSSELLNTTESERMTSLNFKKSVSKEEWLLTLIWAYQNDLLTKEEFFEQKDKILKRYT